MMHIPDARAVSIPTALVTPASEGSMNKFKLRPMLATPFEEARVKKQLPVFAQPKYDGIRCLIKDGIGYSRTLKPIPNYRLRYPSIKSIWKDSMVS